MNCCRWSFPLSPVSPLVPGSRDGVGIVWGRQLANQPSNYTPWSPKRRLHCGFVGAYMWLNLWLLWWFNGQENAVTGDKGIRSGDEGHPAPGPPPRQATLPRRRSREQRGTTRGPDRCLSSVVRLPMTGFRVGSRGSGMPRPLSRHWNRQWQVSTPRTWLPPESGSLGLHLSLIVRYTTNRTRTWGLVGFLGQVKGHNTLSCNLGISIPQSDAWDSELWRSLTQKPPFTHSYLYGFNTEVFCHQLS